MWFGGLRTCATWTFIGVGNFQSVEVVEELTVPSCQYKDCLQLLCPDHVFQSAHYLLLSRSSAEGILRVDRESVCIQMKYRFAEIMAW